MKKTILTLTLFCITLMAVAQNYQVKHNDFSQITVQFTSPTPSVSDVKILDNRFSLLTMDGFSSQSTAGLPALPTLVKLVEVSLCDDLDYTIDALKCDTIDGISIGIDKALAPFQPSRSKSDISPVSLVQDRQAYTTNAFCGASVIELQTIGIARNRNLARLCFNPVRWNPVTNQLIIVKSVTVTIHQQGADIAATRHLKSVYSSPAFNIGVETINNLDSKDGFTTAPLRYTIVAHSSFRGALDTFAAWKKRQGFIVDLVYTDDENVGSTTTSIKNYLQNLYDNATTTNPAPTYVLFVGDIAQVPAFYLSSNGAQHYSDLRYCCWTDGDYLPDCYYGRFSAQTLAQLEPQIAKTLMYEQYSFPDDSYLNTAALIAGVDGGYESDYAYRYADPSMDYAAKTYITSTNGFNNIVYYKNNTNFAPSGVTVTGSSNSNSTRQALIDLYNSGCGFVNYSAHGDNTLWYKPNFTTSDIAELTNNNKPMVMIGNCCLTNSFQVDECFGEALLRKDNNAGAVGYIGASNSTYWDEDFCWAVGFRNNINNTCDPSYDANNLGMYDRLFHTHGEAYSIWHTSMGAMIYSGNMTVEGTSSSRREYYWQIYHLMGDPSLMPYINGTAPDMTANVPSALTIGCNSFTISAVPYAYIGFTDNEGNFLAAAFTDANGNATLTFSPINNVDSHQIVITAQGYKPFVQNINIVSNGPFVQTTGLSMTSNTAGDDVNFNLTLKNFGNDEAESISVELQTNSFHILLDTIGQHNTGYSLGAGQELNITNIVSGTIINNVADQTSSPVTVIIRWGNTINDLSTSTFHVTLNAPKMQYTSHTLQNNFDSAEYSTLTVVNSNNGHASINDVTIELTCLDPTVIIANPSTTYDLIDAGQSVSDTYTITLNGEAPRNRSIPVIQTIRTNGHSILHSDTLKLVFGLDNSLITFEEGWGDYGWSNGDYPWELTNAVAYAGSYSARSRTWSTSSWSENNGNGKDSQLGIEWTSTIDDSITFYKKVSSENGYDKFKFYIDDMLKEDLSGEQDWSRSSYFIPAGTHTFLFSYEKDYSVYNGSDCAWIDNLHLPLNGIPYYYAIDSICKGDQYIFNSDTIETYDLTAGNHVFFDSTATGIYYLTLVINDSPELSVTGGSVIQRGEGARLTATGAERYEWFIGNTYIGSGDILDVFPEKNTIYTVVGYNGSCSQTTTVTVYVSGTIGINSPDSINRAAKFRLYPNPAHDILTIEGDDITGFVICDVTGRQIIKNEKLSSRQISVATLPNGVYFIRITYNNGESAVSKFIKK